MSNARPTDDELFSQYLSGDHAAFSQLYRRYRSEMWAYAYGMTRNADQADEVVQQAMLRLHAGRETHTPGHSLKSWLLKIVRNAALDFFRSASRKKTDYARNASSVLGEDGDFLDFFGGEDDGAEQREEIEKVRTVLGRMPEDHQTALVLHFFEDRTMQEIGKRLGVVRSAVPNRIRKALMNFRERWEGTVALKG